MRLSYFTLLAMLISHTALPQTQSAQTYPVVGVPFDANYFDGGIDRNYGVIVLGGSGGGKADETAARIAAMGYDVLSLAYFDRDRPGTVPQTLELIPLEYFVAPKRWLMDRPTTRDDGVILFGYSKGAELALVLATSDTDYKGLIALAPSHVVWQGNPADLAEIMSSPSSWSRQGQGLPFVPYVSIEERDRLGYSNRHAASLSNEDAVARARIPVADIQAPVLLLSGGADAMWPATNMATEICATMRQTDAAACRHVSFDDGDHLLSNYQDDLYAEVAEFLRMVSSDQQE